MSTINLDQMKDLIQFVDKSSSIFNLPKELVLSIIWQESRGNIKALRFEKSYFNDLNRRIKPDYYAKINSISIDTESALQCFSFGPMQIMGATARDLGFSFALVDLCSGQIGVYYGCKFLSRHYHGSAADAAASFNHGSVQKDAAGKYVNQAYVDSVISSLDSLRGHLS